MEAEAWEPARMVLAPIVASAPRLGTVTGAWGVIAARKGDVATARQALAALDSTARSTFSRGRSTMWQARIAAALGDHDGALSLVRRALAEGYPVMQGFPALPGAPHMFDYAEPSVHADPALASLHRHPEFVRLLTPR